MTPLTPEQRETLRHATLEVLAVRHPAALPARAIRRALAHEVPFAFADDDLLGALAFHVDLRNAADSRDPQGATSFWAATAQGVLAHERGQ